MSTHPSLPHPENEASWFCLKSQPKHEHIAAAHLRQLEGVEVLCPRIRYRKDTARGVLWFTEALFPSYLFARFQLETQHNAVRYAHGVSCLVNFGGRYPEIDGSTIEFLRGADNNGALHVIEDDVSVGEDVRIIAGAFRGLEALVTSVVPAKERVRVLLEFLGRSMEVEVDARDVLRCGPTRLRAGALSGATRGG